MCLKCNSSGLTPSHVQVQVAKGAVGSYCRSSKQRDQRVTMNSIKCTFPRGVKVSSVTSTLTSSCNHDAIITTGRARERAAVTISAAQPPGSNEGNMFSVWGIIAAAELRLQQSSQQRKLIHNEIEIWWGDLATKWISELNKMTAVSSNNMWRCNHVSHGGDLPAQVS